MCIILRKYRNWSRPGIFTVFLFSFSTAFPQFQIEKDTLQKIFPVVINQLRVYTSPDLFLKNSDAGIITPIPVKDKNGVFFDSLKVRASKNQLTRRLYNFVVVRPDTIYKKQFIGTSDANYISYSGKKIRKIVIQRLSVFGADINNPSSDNPNKIENLLNKTHFNTNENIIKKNLLFSDCTFLLWSCSKPVVLHSDSGNLSQR